MRPMLCKQDTNCRPAIPVEKKLAIALWRLSTNCEYRTVGHLFGIGKSTAHKVTREVCSVLVDEQTTRYNKWPSGDSLNYII